MTHYDVLGLKENASQDEIKRAFRKKALELHPDKNPGDPTAEARFKEANEAFQTLSDDKKRRQYDASLHMSNFGGVDIGPFGMDTDFMSRFEEIFGFGVSSRQPTDKTRQRRPKRGGDVVVDVILGLEEAVAGTEKEITYRCAVQCTDCAGRGATSERVVGCKHCNGTGRIQESHGSVRFVTTCLACAGAGSSMADACQTCRGSGSKQAERRLKVTVPPGVDSGDTMRVPNQGNAGVMGGPPGNLFVAVEVRPHERFERHGRELLTSLAVDFTTMALGGTADVTLLDGTSHTLTVGPLTQPGTVIVAKGHGCPSVDTPRPGDLHVRLDVRVPRVLSDETKQKLDELRGLL